MLSSKSSSPSIFFLGNTKSGITSLIKRITSNFFGESQKNVTKSGVNFLKTSITTTWQLWDVKQSQTFDTELNNAVCFCFVISLVKEDNKTAKTQDELEKEINELLITYQSHFHAGKKILFIATKRDLESDAQNFYKKSFSKAVHRVISNFKLPKISYAGLCVTSAKNSYGIDELLKKLAKKLSFNWTLPKYNEDNTDLQKSFLEQMQLLNNGLQQLALTSSLIQKYCDGIKNLSYSHRRKVEQRTTSYKNFNELFEKNEELINARKHTAPIDDKPPLDEIEEAAEISPAFKSQEVEKPIGNLIENKLPITQEKPASLSNEPPALEKSTVKNIAIEAVIFPKPDQPKFTFPIHNSYFIAVDNYLAKRAQEKKFGFSKKDYWERRESWLGLLTAMKDSEKTAVDIVTLLNIEINKFNKGKRHDYADCLTQLKKQIDLGINEKAKVIFPVSMEDRIQLYSKQIAYKNSMVDFVNNNCLTFFNEKSKQIDIQTMEDKHQEYQVVYNDSGNKDNFLKPNLLRKYK